ncbi:PREDICTED: uncharacterized protein LOC105600064 isoform X6 [Cercocebus atys]|uniref:uncharacterized protein LOC105600064 isoform X6 n=1 Tax=Cercocebus atys TaxID=9531 RepID=UPI0005F4FD6F|nr:PREDICTED: uncharacterized protein LOC105600064 isoform X6 [Cercocebus atys]XP_011946252.1 PREDICTED: uncharacterized protein LOC105600064 isoform X6 [Cercocebus atys]XP_011946253.1 PREDICTED: uncharacterized protein LOC105600064 isoform X6 [Cercocebus atys]
MTQQPLGPEPSPGIPQWVHGRPTLQVPEVPVPLRKQLEAQESHPRLHEEMAEYWRTRWHQVAVALKFKEEELQRLQRQSGTWPPQDPHAAAERPECVLKELPSRMQALERENNQMAAGIQRRKGRPQQRPQARLQSLQREGAVGPQVCQGTGVCSVDSTRGQWGVGPAAGVSTKGCSTRRTGASSHLHFTAPESLSLWIQSWVLSRTGPVGPLLGSLDLEQKSSSRTGLDTQNLGTVNCPVIHLVKKAGFK